MDSNVIANLISLIASKLTGYGYNTVNDTPVPLGISNRHVHLSQQDLEVLFGAGYQLTPLKDLSQPGQFAAKECVTIAGPKGAIENVRILGPARKASQVEVMRSDCFKLGASAPLRESGALAGSAPVTIIGPKGSVYCKEGLIVAKRHIHMTPNDAVTYGVKDGEIISCRVNGERGIVFDNVVIRVSDKFALEAHLDMDEANCADLKNGDSLYVITNKLGEKQDINKPAPKTEEKPAAPAAPAKPVVRRPAVSLVTEDIVRRAASRGEAVYITDDAIFTPLAKDAVSQFDVKIIKA